MDLSKQADALRLAELVRSTIEQFFSPEIVEQMTERIGAKLEARLRDMVVAEMSGTERRIRGDIAAYIAESVIVEVRLKDGGE